MELDVIYILSQIAVLTSYSFFGRTYQATSRKKILLLSTLANVCNGISYLLLTAWSGFAMSMIAIIRGVVFSKYIEDGKTNKRDIFILLVFYCATTMLAILTYEGVLSLLPALAIAIYTYAVWQKNSRIYKVMGIIVSIIWITYNIYVQSIFGIILESLMAVLAIRGVIKDKRNKLEKSVDII